MLRNLIAVPCLLVTSVAFAGAANFSVTNVIGSGSSISFDSSVDVYAEGATGMRHLMSDGVAVGDYSHRDEYYSRASASVDTDASITTTDIYISGTVTNATRIGESDMDITTVSHTDGVTTHTGSYTEVGVFYADEVVGDSYSVESGAYVAAGAESGIGFYDTDVYTHTDAYSAYGIYGSN